MACAQARRRQPDTTASIRHAPVEATPQPQGMHATDVGRQRANPRVNAISLTWPRTRVLLEAGAPQLAHAFSDSAR
jgi:hypothetical protein